MKPLKEPSNVVVPPKTHGILRRSGLAIETSFIVAVSLKADGRHLEVIVVCIVDSIVRGLHPRNRPALFGCGRNERVVGIIHYQWTSQGSYSTTL